MLAVEDRRRPARAQAVRERYTAVRVPQRIGRDVFDDHRFAAIRGGAA